MMVVRTPGQSSDAIPARRNERPSRWHFLGVLVTAWALALAAVGIVLAIAHARSIDFRLNRDARLIAELVAAKAFHELQFAPTVPLELFSQTHLKPLVEQYDGLELVPTERVNRSSWWQPLPSPMDAWAIQPAEAMLRSHESALLYPTLAYVGLTFLALVALLGATWILLRLVRREVALAELKSNFVADVSHEIKTPLAMIQLFAETLQSGRVASEEKRQEYYSIMLRESARLTALINNILDFARIEAGRRQYAFLPTEIGAVVRETYETYKPELDRNQFEHRLTVAEGLPTVAADRDAIAQILVNLISNAMKYSADQRLLLIDVKPDTRRGRRGVLVSVEDCGIGIRPEDRARIFEGFYRGADGRVLRQGGTGLGLSLVKHIVEAHGGTLDVEPRLIQGTAFRLFLPC